MANKINLTLQEQAELVNFCKMWDSELAKNTHNLTSHHLSAYYHEDDENLVEFVSRDGYFDPYDVHAVFNRKQRTLTIINGNIKINVPHVEGVQ